MIFRLYFRFLAVLWVLTGSTVLAADPVVENVSFVQRIDGSKVADIRFDLADLDTDTLTVSLQVSPDGGLSWDFPVLNCTGDIGRGIAIGPDKHIVWDLSSLPEALSGGEFQVRILASDQGVRHAAHSPRVVAITDFSRIDFSEPGMIEKFARADLVQLKGASLWRGGLSGDIPVIDRMKEINPDIKVVGYVSAKATPKYQPSPSEDLFFQVWYERTMPYWVFTTAGDTAQDWATSRLINILDPACRGTMVSIVREFQETSLNRFDGVYWDYFNTMLWVPDNLDVIGDPDMDGDGIGHWSDADEMEAFRQAQVELVGALRDTMGAGFIQIFNGQRAYRDSVFAGLADGLMYELFPTLAFPDPDLQSALDLAQPISLFHVKNWLRNQNGGPFMVLENKNSTFFFDTAGDLTEIVSGNQFRAVAMLLDGALASWNSHAGSTGIHTYGYPDQDICIGEPLGPPSFEDNFIRRDFQYGRVEIEMRSGAYPNPFHYRIWALGQLVEELSIPYHFP